MADEIPIRVPLPIAATLKSTKTTLGAKLKKVMRGGSGRSHWGPSITATDEELTLLRDEASRILATDPDGKAASGAQRLLDGIERILGPTKPVTKETKPYMTPLSEMFPNAAAEPAKPSASALDDLIRSQMGGAKKSNPRDIAGVIRNPDGSLAATIEARTGGAQEDCADVPKLVIEANRPRPPAGSALDLFEDLADDLHQPIVRLDTLKMLVEALPGAPAAVDKIMKEVHEALANARDAFKAKGK